MPTGTLLAASAMPTCYRHPDRETGLSCSECGRPICVDCMTPAPVGIRCPDHSGRPTGAARVARSVSRTRIGGTGAPVTKALFGINVAVYLVTVYQGAGINDPGGRYFFDGALIGPLIATGDWWRLGTSAFLHASLLHIIFNMLALWWLGSIVETYLGSARFLALYVASGLAGSAGALLASPPNSITVGASGAIFGILGAMLIIEYQQTGSLAGNALTLIAVNLAFTFYAPNISIGGHLGGLAGGIAGTLALARFGRGHAAYGRLGVAGLAGLLAVAVISVALSYWKVRGLA
ncbi:MAG: rhomboid family intramembrane serine protease [Gaiellaceae bacterium]